MLIEDLANLIDNHYEQKNKKSIICESRLERYSKVLSDLERGHMIFDNIRDAMRKIDEVMPRSIDQILVTEMINAATAAFVYKGELHGNEEEIKRYNRFDSLINGVLFEAPRRFGKTEALVMSIVSYLVACPNIVIVVIANSSNAAGSEIGLLGKVKKLLALVFGIIGDIKNEHHLVIKEGLHDTRELHCFSGLCGDR